MKFCIATYSYKSWEAQQLCCSICCWLQSKFGKLFNRIEKCWPIFVSVWQFFLWSSDMTIWEKIYPEHWCWQKFGNTPMPFGGWLYHWAEWCGHHTFLQSYQHNQHRLGIAPSNLCLLCRGAPDAFDHVMTSCPAITPGRPRRCVFCGSARDTT